MVGALSAINAIAGSHAEDIPVLIIVGGPNLLDESNYQGLTHHSLPDGDSRHCSRAFEQVVDLCITIRSTAESQGKFHTKLVYVH